MHSWLLEGLCFNSWEVFHHEIWLWSNWPPLDQFMNQSWYLYHSSLHTQSNHQRANYQRVQSIEGQWLNQESQVYLIYSHHLMDNKVQEMVTGSWQVVDKGHQGQVVEEGQELPDQTWPTTIHPTFQVHTILPLFMVILDTFIQTIMTNGLLIECFFLNYLIFILMRIKSFENEKVSMNRWKGENPQFDYKVLRHICLGFEKRFS